MNIIKRKPLEKKIHNLCIKIKENKNKVKDLILEYLDNTNRKLEDCCINYYDEDVPLKEIQGNRGIIITMDGEKIYYYDMNFDELIDLYDVISSCFK